MPDDLREVRLRLKAVGQGPPPAIRLRRLLKYALRNCGLRCLEIERARPPMTPREVREVAHDHAFLMPPDCPRIPIP